MDFYTAWAFLSEHKMFHGFFEYNLFITAVKVNPETNEIDNDDTNNTKVQIWLEHGGYDNDGYHMHDFDLDCGGDTFEEAIIKLATLVKKYYTDDGEKLTIIDDYKK